MNGWNHELHKQFDDKHQRYLMASKHAQKSSALKTLVFLCTLCCAAVLLPYWATPLLGHAMLCSSHGAGGLSAPNK